MMVQKLLEWAVGSALVIVLVAACTAAPPTSIPAPTPTATTLPPLSGSGGGRIAFSTNRDGNYEIYVMNADGSDQRRLTNSPYEDRGPTWSPDGTKIAYSTVHLNRSEIWVMNADGSERRRLPSNGGGNPVWSPDGNRIAFTLHNPAGDIWVMNADGSDLQPLTETGNKASVFGLDWSPDGSHMVCVVNTNPLQPLGELTTIHLLDLEQVARDGPAGLDDLPLLAQAGEQVNDQPAWSPLGTNIAFSAVVGDQRQIYVVNPDGTNLRRLVPEGDADAFVPGWSPDGTQIAFQYSPNQQWDIYIMNADGTGLRRLTTHEANDTEPVWAP
jgi:Tol biopolymer transport system component